MNDNKKEGILYDIIQKSIKVTSRTIYVPESLRKYVETKQTKAGTRLKN